MATVGGKKLNQLRVVDLRAELEKRGLDKSGLKGALVERLEKSLLEESADLNDSAELGDVADVKKSAEATQTPNGDVNEDEDGIPEDFSGFIVLDSGDDSDAELDDKVEGKVEEDQNKMDDEVLVIEKNEEEDEDIEQVDLTEDSGKLEGDEDEGSLEYEYQDTEAAEDAPDEHEEEEKVEETKTEDEAVVSTSKPNENQLSLSMCVNTDDVQDDLDEDLKEIEKDDNVEDEAMDEEEETDNVDGDGKEMDTSENVAEEDEPSEETEEKVEEMEVDTEEKTVEEEETKIEAVIEKQESTGKQEESESTQEKSEEKTKENEKKDKKDVKIEDKKDEKKDAKAVKKEEPAKKAAVKKEEKKVEKKTESKDEKKPGADEKKTSADAKKGAADAKKKETGKSLWVSNLSSMTRAADLKTRFTQYGKVVGAKIVTNSKSPGGQCFGLVTMSTSEEAAKCIQHLHRTEMHGRSITVDRAKGDRLPTGASTAVAKKTALKKEALAAAAKTKEAKAAKEKDKITEKKPADGKVKGEKSEEKTPAVKSDVKATAKAGKESDAKGEKGKTDSKTPKAGSAKKDGKDDKSTSHRRSSPALKSLDDVRRERRERQTRDKRERERRERLRRERERMMREKAMERERERMRQRERERRRLQVLREREERERQERLRLERERIRQRELERQRERDRQERERERLRLIQERQLREERERLERERERLERERLQRIERERMDRQRAEARRGVKRPGDPYIREKSPTRGPGYWPETKRAAPERSSDSREFFSGMSGRDRGARDVPESRPTASRERPSERRGSHSTRDEPPRDEHRRTERDRPSASRSSRETPRDRESRDRRTSWEHGAENSVDPQKGLSMLLQRAGVSGILGDVGSRSSLPKPVGPPAGSSSSRERPGDSWNGRTNTHARPMISSHTLEPPGNPVARVARPPVMNEPGRGWPSSSEKEHDRSRERDRGIATRDMSRSAWSGSTNPSNLLTPTHSIDRSRQVIPATRGSALPPRMISQHSAPPMTVPVIDSRRAVAMSRGDPFRGAAMPTMPRSGTMRRY